MRRSWGCHTEYGNTAWNLLTLKKFIVVSLKSQLGFPVFSPLPPSFFPPLGEHLVVGKVWEALGSAAA